MCRPRSHQINFRVFRTFHESIESMSFFLKNNSSFILTQEWNEFFTIIWNLWGESFLCTFVVYQINLSDRSFLGKLENTQECIGRIKVSCKCGNASKHTLQSEPSNREVCCSWEGFRSYQKFVISCFQKCFYFAVLDERHWKGGFQALFQGYAYLYWWLAFGRALAGDHSSHLILCVQNPNI